MSEPRNVDDILTQTITQQPVQPPIVENPDPVEMEDSQPEVEASHDVEETQSDDPYIAHETKDETGNKEETPSPIDEYGNPIDKPKLYTQEEVNAIMRERASRSRNPQNFQPDQNETRQSNDNQSGEQGWEEQLENFIDKAVEKKKQKEAQREWEERQLAEQQEFEERFTAGRDKYSDFYDVVRGKKLTPEFLVATKPLENPAAFVYAASKLYPKEVERIAQLGNPLTIATEVGRLHERMLRERKVASRAGKPLEPPKSDMPAKDVPKKVSIEERIAQYAKSKRK